MMQKKRLYAVMSSIMGGEIDVQSTEGRGSVFSYKILGKRADSDDLQALVRASIECVGTEIKIAPGEARALLVEDYPVNQVFAEKLLRKFGFTRIDLAVNGAEALARYRNHSYDVIFMDCQMPGMDGYQATRKIRELEKDSPRHTPIIAMTANAMMGDREKCLKAGMDEYVSKPLRAEHLKRTLMMWFSLEEAKAVVSVPSFGKAAALEVPVDLAQLRLFTDGDPQEEKELFALFADQAREMISLLAKNTGQDAKEVWKSAAHRFKGASGNLGAMRLHHLCREAESRFEESSDYKQTALAAIEQEMQRVSDFLRA